MENEKSVHFEFWESILVGSVSRRCGCKGGGGRGDEMRDKKGEGCGGGELGGDFKHQHSSKLTS